MQNQFVVSHDNNIHRNFNLKHTPNFLNKRKCILVIIIFMTKNHTFNLRSRDIYKKLRARA